MSNYPGVNYYNKLNMTQKPRKCFNVRTKLAEKTL